LGSLVVASIFLALIDFSFGLFPVLGILMLVGAPLYVYFAYRYANKVEPVRRARSEQNESGGVQRDRGGQSLWNGEV
jgi:Ca2+/Na+ antiporter